MEEIPPEQPDDKPNWLTPYETVLYESWIFEQTN